MDNKEIEINTDINSLSVPEDEIQAILRATRKHPNLFLSGDYEYEIVDQNSGSQTLLKSGKSTRKRTYEVDVSIIDLATGDIGPQKCNIWVRDALGKNHDIEKGTSRYIGRIGFRGNGIKGNKIRAGKFTGSCILVYRVTKV